MTSRRITVSLPEDVADYLSSKTNASAEVAAALGERMHRGQATRDALLAIGVKLDEDRINRIREQMPPMSAEARAEAQQLRDDLRTGDGSASTT
jgi:hypothetical protein